MIATGEVLSLLARVMPSVEEAGPVVGGGL